MDIREKRIISYENGFTPRKINTKDIIDKVSEKTGSKKYGMKTITARLMVDKIIIFQINKNKEIPFCKDFLTEDEISQYINFDTEWQRRYYILQLDLLSTITENIEGFSTCYACDSTIDLCIKTLDKILKNNGMYVCTFRERLEGYSNDKNM